MYYVTFIGISLNNNCFVFIQVMQRRRREDGFSHLQQSSPVSVGCCPCSWCERNSVESRPTPRLVINVDHRIVGIISFVLVLVNPLSATPLFSPARAVLFGLVVYKPRGRRVAKPKICRKAPVSGNAP